VIIFIVYHSISDTVSQYIIGYCITVYQILYHSISDSVSQYIVYHSIIILYHSICCITQYSVSQYPRCCITVKGFIMGKKKRPNEIKVPLTARVDPDVDEMIKIYSNNSSITKTKSLEDLVRRGFVNWVAVPDD